MKNPTLKLATLAILALGAMLPAAYASLHINFSEDQETGYTVVRLSGTHTLADIPFYYDVAGSGAMIWYSPGSVSTAVEGAGGGGAYIFDSITRSGDAPSYSLSQIFTEVPEGAKTAGFDYMSSGQNLALYTEQSAEGTVNWDTWFIIPQSLQEVGMTDNTSGVMQFSGPGDVPVISIGWSVGSQVPEPATCAAIFGIAVIGITLVGRRRK